MKTPKIIQILTGLAITLASAGSVNALAGAGSSGGGDAIILPDDTVILADPYIVPNGTGFNLSDKKLNEKLDAELLRIDRFFYRMGAADDIRFTQTKFFAENIFSQRVEYRFTDSLPSDCDWAPVGASPGSVVHIACTTGPLTLIVGDLFKKMTVREQAKLIVHERLRALSAPAAPSEYIAEMTSALETMLDLYNQQLNGKRPVLTSIQVDQLELFRKRIIDLNLDLGGPTFYRASADKPTQKILNPVEQDILDEDQDSLVWLKVSVNGGGLISVWVQYYQPNNVSKRTIDPAAYIGVGSIMFATDDSDRMVPDSMMYPENDAFINQGATLLDVDCFHTICKIGKNASVNGYANSSRGAYFQSSMAIEEGAVFDNSAVSARTFVQHAHSIIRNSDVGVKGDFTMGTSSVLENTDVDLASLILSDNSSIKNSDVNDSGQEVLSLVLGTGSQLSELNFWISSYNLAPNASITLKDGSVIDGTNLPDHQGYGLLCPRTHWLQIPGPVQAGSIHDLETFCESPGLF